MRHIAEGEWHLGCPESVVVLDAVKLWRYAAHKNLPVIDVELNDIAHKGLDEIDEQSQRFCLADPAYPLLIGEGLPNPYNKLYRMLDGRHRLKKLLLSGANNVRARIMSRETVMQFITINK